MKLNFRSYKRKLFGSSPGRRKSRIRVKSETAKYLRLISTFLIVALIVSISPTVFGADFIKTTRKKTTTTTTTQTVAPPEPGKMTLKAGTYRFNDNIVSTLDDTYEFDFITYLENGNQLHCTKFYIDLQVIEYYSNGWYQAWENGDGWIDIAYQTNIITEDTEVDDTFGTWYISNTNYNEVNGISESVFVLSDVIVNDSAGNEVKASLKEMLASDGVTAQFYTVDTFPTECVNDVVGFLSFYYIKNENDIFAYQGGEWRSLSLLLNVEFKGDITEISQATEVGYYALMKEAKIIKAGTYVFNDTLTDSDTIECALNFKSYGIGDNINETEIVDFVKIVIGVEDNKMKMVYLEVSYTSSIEIGSYIIPYQGSWITEECKTITVSKDQAVDVAFYEWYNTNTDPVTN